jgi:aconitase A
MDKVFKGLRPLRPDDKKMFSGKVLTPGKKFCISCHNEATQFAMFDCLGVTVLERYCDTCIGQKKHLKPNNEGQG